MKTKPTKRKQSLNKLREACNQDAGLQVCGTMNRRRSIPTKEVDEMLKRQAKELHKEPTLYDQRIQCLRSVAALNDHCDHLAARLNEIKLELASERNRLKDLNRELSEELKFDQVQ